MKQSLIIITPLLKFMSEKNYDKFIKYLRKVNKISEDEAIWIIAEWSVK